MNWFDQCFDKLIAHEGALSGWLRPRFSSDYFVDVVSRHAEQNRQLLLCKPAGRPKKSDRVNCVVSMQAQIAVFTMLLVEFRKACVPVVFGIRSPLKICCGIVVFVPVFVINRSRFIWPVSQKCLGNDGVNAGNTSVSQVNGWVSLFCHWAKYSFVPNKSTPVFIGDSMG